MHLDRTTGSCVLKPKVWMCISPLATILSSIGCDPLHYCLMLPATSPHVKYWDCKCQTGQYLGGEMENAKELGSVVELRSVKQKALGWIPSTEKKRKKKPFWF